LKRSRTEMNMRANLLGEGLESPARPVRRILRGEGRAARDSGLGGAENTNRTPQDRDPTGPLAKRIVRLPVDGLVKGVSMNGASGRGSG
jgi:hypothetical protein